MLADTPCLNGFGAALASVDNIFQWAPNSSLPPALPCRLRAWDARLIEFLSPDIISAAFQVALRVATNHPGGSEARFQGQVSSRSGLAAAWRPRRLLA